MFEFSMQFTIKINDLNSHPIEEDSECERWTAEPIKLCVCVMLHDIFMI